LVYKDQQLQELSNSLKIADLDPLYELMPDIERTDPHFGNAINQKKRLLRSIYCSAKENSLVVDTVNLLKMFFKN